MLDASISLSAAKAGQKRKTQKMSSFMPANWHGHKEAKKTKKAKINKLHAVTQRMGSIFPDEYGR